MTFLNSRRHRPLVVATPVIFTLALLLMLVAQNYLQASSGRPEAPKLSAMMVDDPIAHPTIPLPERTTPAPTPSPTPKVDRPKPVTRSYTRPASWVTQFLECVISHESRDAGMYTAENPTSTASGAYQFIDASWQAYSLMAGYPGWSHAAHAPPRVQDAVAAWVVTHKGTYPWKGTHCGYGT